MKSTDPSLPSASSWPHRLISWSWLLIPAAAGALIAWLLFEVAIDYDLWGRARPWLWMPLWPVFGDLDETLQHFRLAARGLDPLSDPSTTFAYPRFFLWLRLLHLQDFPTPPIGYGLALGWVAAVILVLRPRRAWSAAATALLFVAPPVLLGLERGNFDLVLFIFLVGLAALLTRYDRHPLGFAFFVAGIVGASLLKIYPVFALGAGAWADQGRRRLAWIGAGAALAIHWFIARDEILLVLSKFPFSARFSWGCLVIFDWLELYLPRNSWLHSGAWLKLAAMTTYGIGLAGSLLLAHRARTTFAALKLPPFDWTCYWIGTALCCGSFLSTNFAYRWIFLILTVPLLLDVARVGRDLPARWAQTTLVIVGLTLAAPLEGNRAIFLLTQAVNWACVLTIATGFFSFTLAGLPATPPPAVAEDGPPIA